MSKSEHGVSAWHKWDLKAAVKRPDYSGHLERRDWETLRDPQREDNPEKRSHFYLILEDVDLWGEENISIFFFSFLGGEENTKETVGPGIMSTKVIQDKDPDIELFVKVRQSCVECGLLLKDRDMIGAGRPV